MPPLLRPTALHPFNRLDVPTLLADPILIDTTKNVITGRGGFSFATEQMDMAFRADGKKFSLVSGQSPVQIGGYFSAAKLNVISPELCAKVVTEAKRILDEIRQQVVHHSSPWFRPLV